MLQVKKRIFRKYVLRLTGAAVAGEGLGMTANELQQIC
jgi:hypothetical protein